MKTLVILIGPPGSGKSTYAKQLEPLGYVRINQDMFKGNRSSTTKAFDEALNEGKSIVLDRCNITKDQRRPWINKAMSKGYEEIIAIDFSTEKEVCIFRVANRTGHETINENTPLSKITEIVEGFIKSYEAPEFAEGFTVLVQK
jgi:aprataxin